MVYGLGSLTGSLIAAFTLDTVTLTRHFYFIPAFIGVLTFINGIVLDRKVEEGGAHIAQMGFCDRAKKNGKEILAGLKISELNLSVLYICLMGAIVPNVTTYLYYYERSVGMEALELGLLSVCSAIAISLGAIIYSMFLGRLETRTLFGIGCIISGLSAALNLMFVKDITLGLSPFAFMAISNSVGEAFYNAFIFMTGNILFAKLIPPNIETSIYAFQSGLQNLCNLFLANWNTVAWNKWFKVDENNLD